MKSRGKTCLTTIMSFAALAFPAQGIAQEQAESQHHRVHHRYRLVDLGTFGGPESFINAPVNGGTGVNLRGTTVGGSATLVPRPANSISFFCGGLDGSVPFIFHAFKWQDGEVTDLGALPPAATTCSNAQSVNEAGEIVGSSENGLIDPVSGANQFRVVLWKDGEIRDLGTLGGTSGQASQINNSGQITGFAYNAIPDAFTPNGTQIRAFLWENGRMKDLGTVGGPDVLGGHINERGQVAGLSLTNSIANPSTGIPTQDPFLWSKDTGMIDLGSLGGVAGGPSALNNRGQVVGQSSDAADPAACFTGNDPDNCLPFLWDDGKLTNLNTHTIGGNPLTANAINDAGEIVGTALFPNQTVPHAYLWKDGVAKDLGTVNGDCFSEAFAINSRGQVVGQSFSCVTQLGRTFLWDDGTMIDLNMFVPRGSGLQLVEAVAINDRGEIAGDLVPPDCGGGIVPTQGNDAKCGHAFVLVPCEEDNADEKGCEFDSAEARAEAEVPLNPTAQTPPATGSQVKLSPDELVARYRSLTTKRHRRFPNFAPK
jgi:probable HAF family extracellular repeat protein